MENWREDALSGHTHDPNEVTVQIDGVGRLSGAEPLAAERQEAADKPVFVDESGSRGRRIRRMGWIAGFVCAVYAVVLVATLVSGTSDAPWMPGIGEDSKPAGKVKPSPMPTGPGETTSGTGTIPGTDESAAGIPNPTPSGRATDDPTIKPTGTGRPTGKPTDGGGPDPDPSGPVDPDPDPSDPVDPGPDPSGPVDPGPDPSGPVDPPASESPAGGADQVSVPRDSGPAHSDSADSADSARTAPDPAPSPSGERHVLLAGIAL
ncbi:hypothetical protein [Streptomyces sp. N35]|uniref:hypothetical protein n=1 Tax=Streptomyces sp. N35 TaxID=2795730 RepID=UPI0018F6528B|nr:hypothetical protein [Streptomyces sp. N35]